MQEVKTERPLQHTSIPIGDGVLWWNKTKHKRRIIDANKPFMNKGTRLCDTIFPEQHLKSDALFFELPPICLHFCCLFWQF